MPLVKHGKIVADEFTPVGDDQALPASCAVLVSAARLENDAAALAQRGGKIGVVWPNNKDIATLEKNLPQVSLVALVFPKFRDGRAYSQARILRERFNFTGELRATGQVLRDQFLFMARSGFDAFDVEKPGDAEAFTEAVQRYSVFYQPTGDGRTTAFRARLGGLRAGGGAS